MGPTLIALACIACMPPALPPWPLSGVAGEAAVTLDGIAAPARAPLPGPLSGAIDIELRMRVASLSDRRTWRVCGVQLRVDDCNYWQFAFVASPTGSHYLELAERFMGTWQAHGREGPTKLEGRGAGPQHWELGQWYRVRIKLDGRIIRAEVAPESGGESWWRQYELSPAAVRRGQPVLVAGGAEMQAQVLRLTRRREPGQKLALLLADSQLWPGAPVGELERLLRESSWQVARCHPARAAERLVQTGAQMLAIPDGTILPVGAAAAIAGQIANGLSVFVVGGPIGEQRRWWVDGKWLDRRQLDQHVAEEVRRQGRTLFSFDTADQAQGWRRSTSNPEANSTLAIVPAGPDGSPCLRISIHGFNGWDTFYSPRLAEGAIPAGHDALAFWARGDEQTPQLAVEVVERDGSRWIAVVPLETEWRFIVVPAPNFRYWHDSPTGNRRGGPGDQLNLQNARAVNFGLAGTHTRAVHGPDHTIWIDAVASTPRAVLPEGYADAELLLPLFERYYPWGEFSGAELTAPGGRLLARGASGVAAIVYLPRTVASITVPLLAKAGQWTVPAAAIARTRTGGCLAVVGVRGRAAAKALSALRLPKPATAPPPPRRARWPSRLSRVPSLPMLRIRDGHFTLPNGRRWFMIGANYEGWFDRCWRMWDDERFSPALIRADMQKCRSAGINALRVFVQRPLAQDILQGRFYKLDVLVREAARAGIRLLITFTDYGPASQEEVLTIERAVARRYGRNGTILGYDLRNEPHFSTLLAWPFSGRHPALGHNLYRTYAPILGEQAIRARLDWVKRVQPGLSDEDALELAAAFEAWRAAWADLQLGGTALLHVRGRIDSAAAGKWTAILKAVNDTFDRWISEQIAAIRQYDRFHPITVGYNSSHEALPCNEKLDFVSHHVYAWPTRYDNLLADITCMDRCAKLWPGRPITLGEFGFSNGIPAAGGPLSVFSSAVGEALVHLYALHGGYDGCMKWMVNDNPEFLRGASDMASFKHHMYEARFGLFAYDSTARGIAKPITIATRWIADNVDALAAGFELHYEPGEGQIPVRYRLKGRGLAAVGGLNPEMPGLKVQSREPVFAAIAVRHGQVQLALTAPASIEADLEQLLGTPGRISAELPAGIHNLRP